MRVDPNYVSNLAAALDQSSSLEAKLTNELSSGLRVTSLCRTIRRRWRRAR